MPTELSPDDVKALAELIELRVDGLRWSIERSFAGFFCGISDWKGGRYIGTDPVIAAAVREALAKLRE